MTAPEFQPPTRCALYPQCPCGWFGLVDCDSAMLRQGDRAFYEMLPDFVAHKATPATVKPPASRRDLV